MPENTSSDELFGVLITLQGDTWLLPNTAVADVQPFDAIEVHAAQPEWLLGFKRWRGLRLPVISGEALCGLPVADRTSRARLVILNTVGEHSDAGQCIVVAQGYPQLMTLNALAVKLDESREVQDGGVLINRVKIANVSACIPDLDDLDQRLHTALRVASAEHLGPAI